MTGSKPSDNESLLAAARDLTAALRELNLVPAVIGGVAVSLIARARYTADLDAMIVFDTANAEALLEVLARGGFRPRFSDMQELARRARMITLEHNTTGAVVDLALGCLPFESEVLDRMVAFDIEGSRIYLASPEDLVIQKAIAGRPKDLEDIRTIGEIHPKLDRKRIRFWIDQYAELLDTPGLWEQVDKLLDGLPVR